jgi:hypothetical protein
VHSFLAAFVATWGVEYLTPKSHWLMHFGTAYKRWGTLLACFVNERYHKNPKQYATDLKNTSAKPGLSLLKEVVCHALAGAQAEGALQFSVGLVRQTKPSTAELALIVGAIELNPDDVTLRVSKRSRFNKFDTCGNGDVVYIHESGAHCAAQVILNFDVDGESLTFVNRWSLQRNRGDGYTEWTDNHHPKLILTEDILDTLVYSRRRDGSCVALLPCDFR